jgi:hypothetical protein
LEIRAAESVHYVVRDLISYRGVAVVRHVNRPVVKRTAICDVLENVAVHDVIVSRWIVWSCGDVNSASGHVLNQVVSNLIVAASVPKFNHGIGTVLTVESIAVDYRIHNAASAYAILITIRESIRPNRDRIPEVDIHTPGSQILKGEALK